MQIIETIIDNLKKLNVEQIILFGSRAKGNYKKTSDFDIALKGKIKKDDLLKVKEEIEDKIFPYSIDIVIYDNVDEGFKQIIDKTGRVIWKK